MLARTVVLALLASAAAGAFAQQCRIEYQRADNMWAAPGRPDGMLGTETLTLKPGQKQVFITDWRYEKQKNDGSKYYGSHVRIMRNTGDLPVDLVMHGAPPAVGGVADKLGGIGTAATTNVVGQAISHLGPGVAATALRADLSEVKCAASTTAGSGARVDPPTNLSAQQRSPTEIVLQWKPVPNAKEYHLYIQPPPRGQAPGQASVISGTGSGFVIPIPRDMKETVVYHASIETWSQGGVSPRVVFPSVAINVPGGPGGPTGVGAGASLPAGGTSGPAGQQCPPGQFVTGFSASGTLICAAPR